MEVIGSYADKSLCTHVSASKSGTFYHSLYIHNQTHGSQMVEPKSGTILYQMYSVEEGMESHGDLLGSADIIVGRVACHDLNEIHLDALNTLENLQCLKDLPFREDNIAGVRISPSIMLYFILSDLSCVCTFLELLGFFLLQVKSYSFSSHHSGHHSG